MCGRRWLRLDTKQCYDVGWNNSRTCVTTILTGFGTERCGLGVPLPTPIVSRPFFLSLRRMTLHSLLLPNNLHTCHASAHQVPTVDIFHLVARLSVLTCGTKCDGQTRFSGIVCLWLYVICVYLSLRFTASLLPALMTQPAASPFSQPARHLASLPLASLPLASLPLSWRQPRL